MLVLQPPDDGEVTHFDKSIFGCMSCPYIYQMKGHYSDRSGGNQLKQVDDIFGGADSMRGASKTSSANCPKCEYNEAYYYQIQTRSADEPMTTFYKCVKCAHDWKDG